MTKKDKDRLAKIEWLLKIRTPHKEIAKAIKISEHGFYKHYVSLRSQQLRDEYVQE